MNSIMNNYFPIFQVYLKLRDELMEMLVDEDMSFRPPREIRLWGPSAGRSAR